LFLLLYDDLAAKIVHLSVSLCSRIKAKHSLVDTYYDLYYAHCLDTLSCFYAYSCPSFVGIFGDLLQGVERVDSRTNPFKRGGDDISSVSPSYILHKDHTSNGQHSHEEVGQGMRGPARSLTSREASHESIRARPPRAPSWLFGLALPCTFRPSPCTPQAAPFKDPCKGI